MAPHLEGGVPVPVRGLTFRRCLWGMVLLSIYVPIYACLCMSPTGERYVDGGQRGWFRRWRRPRIDRKVAKSECCVSKFVPWESVHGVCLQSTK